MVHESLNSEYSFLHFKQHCLLSSLDAWTYRIYSSNKSIETFGVVCLGL